MFVALIRAAAAQQAAETTTPIVPPPVQPTPQQPPQPPPDVAALRTRALATFGAERLLWGSDFPQTPDASYHDLLELARRATSGFPPTARDLFFGGTALALWPELGGSNTSG